MLASATRKINFGTRQSAASALTRGCGFRTDHHSPRPWREVSPAEPCPLCRHGSWCQRSRTTRRVQCLRPPAGAPHLHPHRAPPGRLVARRARRPGRPTPKYVWLTSRDKKDHPDGPSPELAAFVPYDVAKARLDGPLPRVRVTEGELKALLATKFTGVPT